MKLLIGLLLACAAWGQNPCAVMEPGFFGKWNTFRPHPGDTLHADISAPRWTQNPPLGCMTY